MRGMFTKVRKQLTQSINKLWPDQYFYIIFFGGGKIYETGGGKLVRATEKAKHQAHAFIESVNPAGQTNAIAALKRAMQIRDEQQHSAEVVYFLTDGFELTGKAGEEFLQHALRMQKQFAPLTQINTIGFWPQRSDRLLLERLSKQSGGEPVFVGDDNI
jgi:Mg-chelatase subunit ChlD